MSRDPRWEQEPEIGHTRVDAEGSSWRKVRMLGDLGWGRALADAIGEARVASIVGRALDPSYVTAMGYELVNEDTPKA